MSIKELLGFSKDELHQAKLCSDEIVDILNRYDLKPLLVKSILTLTAEEASVEIDRIIKEANA